MAVVSTGKGGFYLVAVEGLKDIDISSMTPKIIEAASEAVNDTSRRALARAGREIVKQVNFKPRYVTGKDGKLAIRKYSKPNPGDLSSIISGTRRATSLAQFAQGAVVGGSGRRKKRDMGVRVVVKPGAPELLKNGFLIKLKRGTQSADGPAPNIGLAYRSRTEGRRSKRIRRRNSRVSRPRTCVPPKARSGCFTARPWIRYSSRPGAVKAWPPTSRPT